MLIRLDNREKDLISKIEELISSTPSFKDLELKVENLPLGDVIISNDISSDIVIIERKTVRDLNSSIKDGRYEEQSYRLNGIDHHNHNIIYLIEGIIHDFRPNSNSNQYQSKYKNYHVIDKNMIYSALTSLNLYKGFSLMRTFDIYETAFFICNMANKIKKNKSDSKKLYYDDNTVCLNMPKPQLLKVITDPELEKQEDEQEIQVQNEEKEYVNVVKKVKKENVTQENIGEIMLCQIPGVSVATSLAIMKEYKTITNLIKCLEQDPKCLDKMSYLTSKGQTRKITKTSITNILKYLK